MFWKRAAPTVPLTAYMQWKSTFMSGSGCSDGMGSGFSTPTVVHVFEQCCEAGVTVISM